VAFAARDAELRVWPAPIRARQTPWPPGRWLAKLSCRWAYAAQRRRYFRWLDACVGAPRRPV